MDVEELKKESQKIRRIVLKMLAEAGSGHPGGSLSCTDIVTVLYFSQMKHNPKDPNWVDRDRFVLSKGHSVPAVYAALAECGYFDEDDLMKLRKPGCHLQGHPTTKTPGIEICTGSLGQGLSVANGMAIAGKLDNKDYHVYCIIGDGESQEGQIWEAAMTAPHRKLDNVIAFLDHNNLQIDGTNDEVKRVMPLKEKWEAFGWHVICIDGHDHEQIVKAIEEAKTIKEKPKMIIAETIKGKGVSFMENQAGWHGRAPNKEELETALKELGE
ncbi:MAG: transketolase [bacterium]|nr:transketolase [bacterium]